MHFLLINMNEQKGFTEDWHEYDVKHFFYLGDIVTYRPTKNK